MTYEDDSRTNERGISALRTEAKNCSRKKTDPPDEPPGLILSDLRKEALASTNAQQRTDV